MNFFKKATKSSQPSGGHGKKLLKHLKQRLAGVKTRSSTQANDSSSDNPRKPSSFRILGRRSSNLLPHPILQTDSRRSNQTSELLGTCSAPPQALEDEAIAVADCPYRAPVELGPNEEHIISVLEAEKSATCPSERLDHNSTDVNAVASGSNSRDGGSLNCISPKRPHATDGSGQDMEEREDGVEEVLDVHRGDEADVNQCNVTEVGQPDSIVNKQQNTQLLSKQKEIPNELQEMFNSKRRVLHRASSCLEFQKRPSLGRKSSAPKLGQNMSVGEDKFKIELHLMRDYLKIAQATNKKLLKDVGSKEIDRRVEHAQAIEEVLKYWSLYNDLKNLCPGGELPDGFRKDEQVCILQGEIDRLGKELDLAYECADKQELVLKAKIQTLQHDNDQMTAEWQAGLDQANTFKQLAEERERELAEFENAPTRQNDIRSPSSASKVELLRYQRLGERLTLTQQLYHERDSRVGKLLVHTTDLEGALQRANAQMDTMGARIQQQEKEILELRATADGEAYRCEIWQNTFEIEVHKETMMLEKQIADLREENAQLKEENFDLSFEGVDERTRGMVKERDDTIAFWKAQHSFVASKAEEFNHKLWLRRTFDPLWKDEPFPGGIDMLLMKQRAERAEAECAKMEPNPLHSVAT